ncbi:MAG: hypothetical protein OXH86_03105 [Acidimicrobiaceae bacterium]|nr:hypothetical protein [Acidimicrobiaceae bacterium]
MTSLDPSPPAEFHERVEGTWGEFETLSGRVSYIMTNARLGRTGTDWEHRLTRKLRPVREVLDIADMDFGQLLQRDLDDYRVANELVPYLLSRATTGPSFFPPILALLLPFEDPTTPGSFPDLSSESVEFDGAMRFREQRFGSAFRFQRLWDPEADALSSLRYGRLGWNDEHAKVVVLDGQHRAMALLAIDRTMNGGWDDAGRGARYRHFYEDRIKAEIGTNTDDALRNVHVPVTVCWFPDLVGSGTSPHVAARALFVDVNRNARAPSIDRVVLLSDDDLLNIFVRSLLNDLRGTETNPPLAAVEYDNPTQRTGPPTKWSAISSLQAFVQMVERILFSGEKFVDNVNLPVRGRPRELTKDTFLREQLDVRTLFAASIETNRGPFSREELSRSNFPREAVAPLTERFLEGWGRGLLHLLGNLLPYQAHTSALLSLAEQWRPADESAVDALAREAVYEGVGMYWVLLNSHRHWTDGHGAEDSQPDVVQAWSHLTAKRDSFKTMRATEYLGAEFTAADLGACDDFFRVVSTQACQAGLALTFATLARKSAVESDGIAGVARSLATAINAGLSGIAGNGRSRKLCLASEVEHPFNQVRNMNPDRSIEFRYQWLEVAATPEGLAAFEADGGHVDPELLLELRDLSRTRYAALLIDERIQELRRGRNLDKDDALVPATIEVTSSLRAALSKWFDIGADEFNEWAAAADVGLADIDDDDFDGDL